MISSKKKKKRKKEKGEVGDEREIEVDEIK